jgi:hypothetical protein
MRRMFYSTGCSAAAAWCAVQAAHSQNAFVGLVAVAVGCFAIGIAAGLLLDRFWFGIAIGFVATPFFIEFVWMITGRL